MKYIAIFDDDMLCDFRRDDNGLTLVLDDSHGFTRAVGLKPIIKPIITSTEGESAYLSDGHIKALMDYEQYKRFKKLWNIDPDEKSTES